MTISHRAYTWIQAVVVLAMLAMLAIGLFGQGV